MTRFSDTFLLGRRFSLRAHPRQGSGFTLVEMLAVIGIIGVLGTAIGIALSGSSNSSASLGNGQRMISSMFQAARTNAVMKGQETAVIIYKAPGTGRIDPEKYLRFVGIVYKDNTDNRWKPLNRGSYLPKGVYFVPPDGDHDFGGGVSSAAGAIRSQSEESIAFPIASATADRWYAYSFDKNGNLAGGSTYLIFTPASIKGPPATNGKPELSDDITAHEMVGIAIRKTGGALMLETLGDGVYNGLSSSIGNME